jgi:hypothetical protein
MIALLYRLFGPMQGTTITVSRPTTSDGEQVSLTTTARIGAPAMEIAEKIETLSLAAQVRMAKQNELLLKTQSDIAHQKWLAIHRKLEAGAKLSTEERRWWHQHGDQYDEGGIKLDVKDAEVIDAAESPRE